MATTGRRLLIGYSRTPDVNFFHCRQCRIGIALTEELVYRSRRLELGIFGDIANVHVEGPEDHQRWGIFTLAPVFCTLCDSHLGWNLIEMIIRIDVLIPGRFILFLNKLLKWEGGRMLYADTNEPVGNA